MKQFAVIATVTNCNKIMVETIWDSEEMKSSANIILHEDLFKQLFQLLNSRP